MRTLLGLFRRQRGGVGLKTEPSDALENNLSASRRLPLHAALEYELDCIINAVTAVADGSVESTDHHRFTEYKKSHEHYRNLTEVRFMYTPGALFPACAFYVEHPESKQLLPIVRCVQDRRFNGAAVVWLSDHPHEEPLVVRESTRMYASDEPEIAGKTLEQVGEQYGKD